MPNWATGNTSVEANRIENILIFEILHFDIIVKARELKKNTEFKNELRSDNIASTMITDGLFDEYLKDIIPNNIDVIESIDYDYIRNKLDEIQSNDVLEYQYISRTSVDLNDTYIFTDSGIVYADFHSNSAWSVSGCVLEETRDNITYLDIARSIDIDIEIDAEEYGQNFYEVIHIKDGELVKDETGDLDDRYYEEYHSEAYEYFKDEYGLEISKKPCTVNLIGSDYSFNIQKASIPYMVTVKWDNCFSDDFHYYITENEIDTYVEGINDVKDFDLYFVLYDMIYREIYTMMDDFNIKLESIEEHLFIDGGLNKTYFNMKDESLEERKNFMKIMYEYKDML